MGRKEGKVHIKYMLRTLVSAHKINDCGYGRSSSIEIADAAIRKQLFMHSLSDVFFYLSHFKEVFSCFRLHRHKMFNG